MFKPKTDLNATSLKMAIDKLFEDLSKTDAGTPEYNAISDQIVKLYELRETDAKVASSQRMTPDVKATIAANLAGIAIIVGHERAHVLTSKAITMLKNLHR
jgi:hypothetical protein